MSYRRRIDATCTVYCQSSCGVQPEAEIRQNHTIRCHLRDVAPVRLARTHIQQCVDGVVHHGRRLKDTGGDDGGGGRREGSTRHAQQARQQHTGEEDNEERVEEGQASAGSRAQKHDEWKKHVGRVAGVWAEGSKEAMTEDGLSERVGRCEGEGRAGVWKVTQGGMVQSVVDSAGGCASEDGLTAG